MTAKDTPYARLDRRLERSIQDLPLQILRALVDRPGTARQLGHLIEADPETVLEHLVDLWEDGCIEQAPGVQADDPLDRRYRVLSCFLDDPTWEALSKADREALTATSLQVIFTEILVAMKAGTFDERTDRHLSCKQLRLDEEGWREVMGVMRRALSEVEAVEERSHGRLVRSGDECVEAYVGLMGFERGEILGS